MDKDIGGNEEVFPGGNCNLSMREYYAAAALTGLLAGGARVDGVEQVTRSAFNYADWMLRTACGENDE